MHSLLWPADYLPGFSDNFCANEVIVRDLSVADAWLLEELRGGRLRILTQETQNGAPAVALAQAKPNPMIDGHQDGRDGLVTAARRAGG